MEFHYQGRDKSGKLSKGTRQAETADTLSLLLLAEGIIPVSITPVTTQKDWREHFPSLFSISHEEMLIFCQQMGALLQAGIPLLTALQRVGEALKNKKFRQICQSLAESVRQGSTLSYAMETYPSVFSPILCNLIKVGEESGNLVDIFKQLIDYLSFEETTKKRILTALRYPATVLLVVFAAIIVINIFVIPVFAKLYEGFNVSLPLPTQIIIAFSNFMRNHSLELGLGFIFFTVVFFYYRKTETWRLFSGKWILRLPIFGELISRLLLARFAKTLAVVYESGIPLTQGLKLVADSNSNLYAKKSLLQLRDYLAQGDSLSSAAAKTPFFSSIIVQMLMVGEETGSLDTILFQIATYYETTIDFDVKRLADRMEPLLLIVVGGVVLVLALGVLMPMWNIINVVRVQ